MAAALAAGWPHHVGCTHTREARGWSAAPPLPWHPPCTAASLASKTRRNSSNNHGDNLCACCRFVPAAANYSNWADFHTGVMAALVQGRTGKPPKARMRGALKGATRVWPVLALDARHDDGSPMRLLLQVGWGGDVWPAECCFALERGHRLMGVCARVLGCAGAVLEWVHVTTAPDHKCKSRQGVLPLCGGLCTGGMWDNWASHTWQVFGCGCAHAVHQFYRQTSAFFKLFSFFVCAAKAVEVTENSRARVCCTVRADVDGAKDVFFGEPGVRHGLPIGWSLRLRGHHRCPPACHGSTTVACLWHVHVFPPYPPTPPTLVHPLLPSWSPTQASRRSCASKPCSAPSSSSHPLAYRVPWAHQMTKGRRPAAATRLCGSAHAWCLARARLGVACLRAAAARGWL